MWQTKYAAAIPKNLGVGGNFPLWASVVRVRMYVCLLALKPWWSVTVKRGLGIPILETHGYFTRLKPKGQLVSKCPFGVFKLLDFYWIDALLIRGNSITTWTRWGGRGSKNVCFCPRSGYKNCPRRGGGGGQKMAKFCPRSCWMIP
jgi:hypothetical protein